MTGREHENVMCECEHKSHFDKGEKSPNGNPNHKYGVNYHRHYIVEVKTIYGVIKVCKDCAKDCWHPDNASTLILSTQEAR